jgi:hypothetical protein
MALLSVIFVLVNHESVTGYSLPHTVFLGVWASERSISLVLYSKAFQFLLELVHLLARI